tara:strand:- start:888 stop:1367 length:480 start_codon:yes stop_codon:yes gene_type:complete
MNESYFDDIKININEFQQNEEFSVDDLMFALENEEHTNLIDMTPEKLEDIKLNAIVELQLSEEESEKIRGKLEGYMYVDEIPDVKYGSYIRWIPLKNPNNLKLTNGGLVTGIDVCVTGTVLTCKNHLNKFFRVKMDEAMIFKRLTNQERVILAALKYLS